MESINQTNKPAVLLFLIEQQPAWLNLLAAGANVIICLVAVVRSVRIASAGSREGDMAGMARRLKLVCVLRTGTGATGRRDEDTTGAAAGMASTLCRCGRAQGPEEDHEESQVARHVKGRGRRAARLVRPCSLSRPALAAKVALAGDEAKLAPCMQQE